MRTDSRVCSAFSMVLADTKIKDDVRDTGSWRMGLMGRILRDETSRARSYFSSLDPRFEERIDSLVAAHLALEKPGNSVPIAQYLEPTASAFGYMFSLMASIAPLAAERDLLMDVGREIGSALLSYDCAADWRSDQMSSQFNPLSSEAEIADALLLSNSALLRALHLCSARFGHEGESASILRSMVEPSTSQGVCSMDNQKSGIGRAKEILAMGMGAVPSLFAQDANSKSSGDGCFGCCALICCLIVVAKACEKPKKVGQIDIYEKQCC